MSCESRPVQRFAVGRSGVAHRVQALPGRIRHARRGIWRGQVMPKSETHRVLCAPISGRDPRSTQRLPAGSILHTPDVLRALLLAVSALEGRSRAGAPQGGTAAQCGTAMDSFRGRRASTRTRGRGADHHDRCATWALESCNRAPCSQDRSRGWMSPDGGNWVGEHRNVLTRPKTLQTRSTEMRPTLRPER